LKNWERYIENMDKIEKDKIRSEIVDLHVNKSKSYNQILEDLIMKYPHVDMYELAQLISSAIGRPKATKLILKKDVAVDIPVESSPFVIKYEPPPDS